MHVEQNQDKLYIETLENVQTTGNLRPSKSVIFIGFQIFVVQRLKYIHCTHYKKITISGWFFSRRFLKPSRKQNLQTVFFKTVCKKFIIDGFY
jgi:hypothetical protein